MSNLTIGQYAVASSLQGADKFLIQRGETGDPGAAYFQTPLSAIAAYIGVGSGDVSGPNASTDNAIVRFDGTTGKLIQNSSVTINDSGNILTSGTIIASNFSGSSSGVNTGDQTNITGNAGTVTTINGRIQQGTNVTITGTGTSVDPYIINASNGGGGTWGSITGTLSNQTDLQNALNAKANVAGQIFTGAISATNLSGTNTGDQTITLTSEATGSGTGSFAVTLTNSAVIGKVLTGYTSGAGTISAADNILQAIQKLNGNDGLKANLSGATFTGAISATNLSGTNTGDQTITLTGEATGSGTGSFAVTLTNSAVISKVLTGYTSGTGTISATDTILQAIQKLNGNDALKAPLASPTFTGTVSGITAAMVGAQPVSATSTVASSRSLTPADNGQTLEITASSVAITVPTGLPSSFSCIIIPNTGTTIVSSGGTLLNGATTTLTREGSVNTYFGIIGLASASNSYKVGGA